MRTYSACLFVAIAFGAVTSVPLSAQSPDPVAATSVADGTLFPVNDKTDAAWLAKARADYPLTTCSVSGDKLDGGDMGQPLDYVYKQAGKTDRLIRFCCKDCLKDFKKDPAKYLKAIDDAAAAAKADKS